MMTITFLDDASAIKCPVIPALIKIGQSYQKLSLDNQSLHCNDVINSVKIIK